MEVRGQYWSRFQGYGLRGCELAQDRASFAILHTRLAWNSFITDSAIISSRDTALLRVLGFGFRCRQHSKQCRIFLCIALNIRHAEKVFQVKVLILTGSLFHILWPSCTYFYKERQVYGIMISICLPHLNELTDSRETWRVHHITGGRAPPLYLSVSHHQEYQHGNSATLAPLIVGHRNVVW